MPDGCSLPTVTFTVTQKLPLTTNVDGELDVVALPCLAVAALSSRTSLPSTSTIMVGSTTGGDAVGVGSGAGFDVDSLAKQFTHYRIVGWGARVRATAGLNEKGELVGAVMPLKGLAPGLLTYQPGVVGPDGTTIGVPRYCNSSAGPVDTLARFLNTLGIPISGDGNTAKIALARLVTAPVHGTASHSQIASRGLHFRSKPFEPESAMFKRTDFRSTGTDSIDVGWNTSAMAASQQYGVDLSCYKIGGFESIIVGGTGYQANTLVGTIELIYHCEATPNLNLATITRPSVTPSPVDPAEHQLAHRRLSNTPHISFADVVSQGEDYLLGAVEGAASDVASRGLSSLAGMLGRMMSAG